MNSSPFSLLVTPQPKSQGFQVQLQSSHGLSALRSPAIFLQKLQNGALISWQNSKCSLFGEKQIRVNPRKRRFVVSAVVVLVLMTLGTARA